MFDTDYNGFFKTKKNYAFAAKKQRRQNTCQMIFCFFFYIERKNCQEKESKEKQH